MTTECRLSYQKASDLLSDMFECSLSVGTILEANQKFSSNHKKMLVFVIIGAESTGKTSLAKALAKHFDAPYLPEFVRFYFDFKKKVFQEGLSADDVEKILIGQHLAEEMLFEQKPPLVFLDTNLLMSQIYANYYYANTPKWLDKILLNKPYTHYLFCQNDIGWSFDEQRDSEIVQQTITDIIKEKLTSLAVSSHTVYGQNNARLLHAINFVNEKILL